MKDTVTQEGPRFQHDCKHCVYLGTLISDYFGSNEPFDLYFCSGPNVVARMSNDGPDYMSGLIFADRNKNCIDADGVQVPVQDRPTYPLVIAAEEAVRRGLLPINWNIEYTKLQ